MKQKTSILWEKNITNEIYFVSSFFYFLIQVNLRPKGYRKVAICIFDHLKRWNSIWMPYLKFHFYQVFSKKKRWSHIRYKSRLPPKSMVSIANLDILNMLRVQVRQANKKLKLWGHWRICREKTENI